MTGSIFFITGASGVGTSTLKHNLDILFSQDTVHIDIHDFNEGAIPSNQNALWRQEKTNSWLALSIKNAKNDVSTIICGGSVPLEVLGSSEFVSGVPLHFGFAFVSRDLHIKRLKKRKWTSKKIKSDLNWSSVLEMCVEKEKGFMLDVTSSSPEGVAMQFSSWIIEQIDRDVNI